MTSRLKVLLSVIAVGVVGGLSYSTYHFYDQNKKAQLLLANPQALSQKESEAVIAQVSKLMELPAETPSIATVLDVEKLKEQPFFSKASNGDKVLIFSTAKKAILFRPSTSKIIEVDPIAVDTPLSPTPTPKKEVTPTPSVEATPTEAAQN